jgi:hypothetical protein
MGHHQIQVNSTSPRVSKTIVVEIWRPFVVLKVIQSFNVVIPTIGVETIAPNTMLSEVEY